MRQSEPCGWQLATPNPVDRLVADSAGSARVIDDPRPRDPDAIEAMQELDYDLPTPRKGLESFNGNKFGSRRHDGLRQRAPLGPGRAGPRLAGSRS